MNRYKFSDTSEPIERAMFEFSIPINEYYVYMKLKRMWLGVDGKAVGLTIYYGADAIGVVIDEYGEDVFIAISKADISPIVLSDIESGAITGLDFEITPKTPVPYYGQRVIRSSKWGL